MSEHWTRVSKHELCPVCDHPDWCTISPDGTLACCMRAESDWPVKNGGFIHRLKESTSAPPPKWRHAKVEDRQSETTIENFAAMFARYQDSTPACRLQQHAADLGVSVDSLVRIGIAWAGPHRAWAFAMRDEQGRICGIRLRAENGSKWAVTGSKQGLFWPAGISPPDLPVLITEGPTDCAAALDLGFYAIGRPACRGMETTLTKMLKGRDVVIMGDRDEPKTRPDGTTWLPGKEGAEALARGLFGRTHSVKIVYPALGKGKDIRAWLRNGATHSVLRIRIQQAHLWTP